ncbi:hypothetical protein LPMP_332590 [Leishmania panamensis]|uniref:Uncharacterized protein n=1 Tax=Leishmania panamensis TaxID=5679 RepID=A0A088S1V7_LEIPA|nr:hypothetical protein LPMP_332590 [Leishmania panamensis]AIO01550.1 hypothetical protein LPMP_332590 [Leishmania panamensis]
MPTEEKATVSPTNRFATQHPSDDVSSWLRRPYTRTISKEIRTTLQLQRSFEDIREQWRDLCETYTHARVESSSCRIRQAGEAVLPHGTRGVVDRLMSQLKSVKQELLAHLSRLSGALAVLSVSLPTETSAPPLPAWVSDLMECSDPLNARTVRVAENSEAMQSYLQAIWLARRVWVWSLCFASVTMDLELLSGSVSVAAELFFGNAFATAIVIAPERNGVDHVKSDGLLLHSTYNIGGAISERLLYATVAAAASASSESGTGNAISCFDDIDSPPHILAKLDDEACEVAAFFGCSASWAKCAGDPVGGAYSMHVGPDTVAVACDDPTPLSKTCGAAPVRDIFWVQAAALCYSAIVCDDAATTRLLAVFEAAKDSFPVEEAERFAQGDFAAPLTAAKVPDQANPPRQPPALQSATVVVLLAAKLLVDEDFNALQQLLRRAGFDGGDDSRPANDEQDCSRSSLATLCPQGVLLGFLIRLLVEHVVRRRWTEHRLGQAFRPTEPLDIGAGDAAAGSGETKTSTRYRLACALANGVSRLATMEPDHLDDLTTTPTLFHGTKHLCNALQMSTLHNMGGDWPLPPALLRGVFA